MSFDATASLPAGVQTVVTGNPVRPGFSPDESVFRAPAATEPFRLLVIGGSQGARIFSDIVPAAVRRLPEAQRRRLRIQQQCRPEDLNRVLQVYAENGIEAEVTAFFKDMPAQLARAHLLISRAGASSLTEIMAMGRASILVPYAAAADDHQRANAEALAANRGCIPILQPAFDAPTLATELAALMADPERLEAMATRARTSYRDDAAAKLAEAVLALIGREPVASADNHRATTETVL